MKCILVINTDKGNYRVYWDLKHNDWFILMPNFKCSRNIGHIGLNEYRNKIEKRINEARESKITFVEC